MILKKIYTKWQIWRGKAIDIWSKSPYPANVLSNLHNNTFVIDNVSCTSMEGFLQSLKYKDVDMQKAICQLAGKAAKEKTNIDWQANQQVYWRGSIIDRQSYAFQTLILRAYQALFYQNEDFRNALLSTAGQTLYHSRGESNPYKTILTEQEFCSILTNMRDSYLKKIAEQPTTAMKLCFPHHKRGDFETLQQAISVLKTMTYGWRAYVLQNIVQYNICYRDHLRRYGIDSLIERLIAEASELQNETEILQELRCWWNETQTLADYDIQCYHIEDTITVLGHTFHGLQDVRKHCSLIGKVRSENDYHIWIPNDYEQYPNVYVAELYESYPVFDIYDMGDSRTYDNYIFQNHPIVEKDLIAYHCKVSGSCNYCKVHEKIPHKMLPILYYKGEGNYMLLATAKDE